MHAKRAGNGSFADRVRTLQPEGAYQVLARAQELEAAGRDIIHLEIGEPDFATPASIADAGIDAIQRGCTRYNPTPGIGALREAIAADAGQRRGVAVKPSHVVVAPGAKPILFFPTLALIQPGDEVVHPDPGFPTYEGMIAVAGGVPVSVPLSEEKSFSFDLEALDRAVSDRTRLIVLNSPSNPTGGVIPAGDLLHIADVAKKYDCWVLSDEVYARMVYDDSDAPSILSIEGMEQRTIVVDGFSKTYSMTGWRLGYGIMPEELAQKVSLLLVHAVGCTAHFTQFAGIEALTGPQQTARDMVAQYRKRRDALVDGLNAIDGVTCLRPQDAFYVFPNISALGRPSAELANLLLDEAGVAVLPGSAFGAGGEGYLRLCYANTLANIRDAVQRIDETLRPLSR
jgi:aspartate/methionine/tyrosine aminotransferase